MSASGYNLTIVNAFCQSRYSRSILRQSCSLEIQTVAENSMRSIQSGHLKTVMHGASMRSWRDLCVRLNELGLFLSLLLPNQHWICQNCCGRYVAQAIPHFSQKLKYSSKVWSSSLLSSLIVYCPCSCCCLCLTADKIGEVHSFFFFWYFLQQDEQFLDN